MKVLNVYRQYNEFRIALDLGGEKPEYVVGTIQPSGAVYLRWTRFGRDAYIYDHNLDRACGACGGFIEGWGDDALCWTIPTQEMRDAIDEECARLRDRNSDWDIRYAPGASFRGNETCG